MDENQDDKTSDLTTNSNEDSNQVETYKPTKPTKILSTKNPDRKEFWRTVWWLFILPFFLAQAIYYPLLIILLSTTNAARGDYGASAALFSLSITAVPGLIYGWYISDKSNRNEKDRFGVVAAPSPGARIVYSVGEACWFPIAVVTPCASLFVAINWVVPSLIFALLLAIAIIAFVISRNQEG